MKSASKSFSKSSSIFSKLFNFVTYLCVFLSHFVNLGVRYYLFTVFFFSGLNKASSWDSTKFLFQNEYKVTWLPLPQNIIDKYHLVIPKMDPILAAYIGTGAELVLPTLLLLGIGARIPAIMFFIFNYVCLMSYPFLWTDVGIAGFKDHFFWGALIGYTLFYGPGKLSLDQLIKFKYKDYKY